MAFKQTIRPQRKCLSGISGKPEWSFWTPDCFKSKKKKKKSWKRNRRISPRWSKNSYVLPDSHTYHRAVKMTLEGRNIIRGHLFLNPKSFSLCQGDARLPCKTIQPRALHRGPFRNSGLSSPLGTGLSLSDFTERRKYLVRLFKSKEGTRADRHSYLFF